MFTTTREIKTTIYQRQEVIVAFVPERLENLSGFARQIYLLATDQGRPVVYIALQKPGADRLAAERELVTLTALTQDAALPVSGRLVKCRDWKDALMQYTRAGDLVIWPEEQLLAPDWVENELGIRQVVLEGEWAAVETRAARWMRQAVTWLAAAVLLAGFTWLEFALWGTAVAPAWKNTGLLVLFAGELGSFYLWDRLSG